MGIKISRLEAENIKRIRAVQIEPAATGLTVVGGDNRQGKTSVLDAICWALGGGKYKPSQPNREGASGPATIKVVLDNGFIVERKGKNGSLKVTDPNGEKAGQQMLDDFIGQFALDLPKFLHASGKEKAEVLLRILGIGDKLEKLDKQEAELYNKRHAIGQIADQKKKAAKEMPYYTGFADNVISAADLIKQQQDILAKNGENQRKRDNLHKIEQEYKRVTDQMEELQIKKDALESDLAAAHKTAKGLQDESTAEIEQSIANIEETNRKIRANLDKSKAEDEAQVYSAQYDQLTASITAIRDERSGLLGSAELPLPGLAVEGGKLTYKGQEWDNMAGSEQLQVATAIVRKLNPSCGFVLLDKLEQMDLGTLQKFGAWLEGEGLQAIATRVSTGDECSIIIEDGYSRSGGTGAPPQADQEAAAGFIPKKWEAGEF